MTTRHPRKSDLYDAPPGAVLLYVDPETGYGYESSADPHDYFMCSDDYEFTDHVLVTRNTGYTEVPLP